MKLYLQQCIADWGNTEKTYKPNPLLQEVNVFERPKDENSLKMNHTPKGYHI